jgi:CO/xanthine dehydrogenase FAD-binding subunit
MAPAMFHRPATLAEALALLAPGDARVLAGGTDLYPATRDPVLPGPVVDIARLPGLRGISGHGGGLRIGACTTWADIAAADLPPALDALRQAAREVGGRQIQAAGTIGGNLCNASPAADGVPPLLAVGAGVELAGPAGGRRLALGDFLTGPRRTALAPGEVLVAVHVPAAGLAGRSAFLKLGARAYLVISIAMVAVRLEIAAGRVAAAAVAVGSCAPAARRLAAVEAALVGAALAEAAGRVDPAAVVAGLDPIGDVRASADYRAEAAAVLVRRAVARLAEGG